MRLIRSIKDMSRALSPRPRRGRSVGFVPTMGYLHEGHLSLIRRARKEADIVVVSIFVNPIQFCRGEDFKRYPRDLKRDLKLCGGEGIDFVFAPDARAMYPKGFSTHVMVEGLTETLCGKFRPGHFKGVTTVIAKLFNIVRPDVAYFGQKDAQQAAVIKCMAQDLNAGVKIKVLPIVRERDGLAMSSRNVYLSPEGRKAASTIYRALQGASNLVKSGDRDRRHIVAEIKKRLSPAVTAIDYISVVDPTTLKDLKSIKKDALIAIAVWIDKTRLIDNILVRR